MCVCVCVCVCGGGGSLNKIIIIYSIEVYDHSVETDEGLAE